MRIANQLDAIVFLFRHYHRHHQHEQLLLGLHANFSYHCVLYLHESVIPNDLVLGGGRFWKQGWVR